MKKRNLFQSRFFSAAEFTKYYQLSLFSILIFGVFLSSCSVLPNKAVDPLASAPTEFTFEQHEVVTGSAKRQTVLTGFLLGGPIAELAVVHIDENNNRHLRIHAFDNDTWAPRLDTTLRSEVMFVDVANIDGRDRFLTYEEGRLNWFDPESETEHILVTVTSMIPPHNGNIPHVDITHDLNSDDRDDLVIPDSDGFWVFVQTNHGAFADPVKLGPGIKMDQLYILDSVDGYRCNPWSQSRIHEIDYNRDGRNDLVFWNQDHFEVHHQNEYGLFSAVATTFTTDVVFDSDDLTSLAAPHGVRRRRRDHQPIGALTGRVMHSLADRNGDEVADLGVFSLEGGSLWYMYSTYEVYFGMPTPDGSTTFASEVGTAIVSDGIPFSLVQHDFDGDNQVDMMFTTITPEVLRIITMIIDSMLTDSVSLDLGFYRMEKDIYPDNPNTIREVKSYPTNETGERNNVTRPC